jgi:hypothetical protein
MGKMMKKSLSSSSTLSYATIGDIANIACIASTLVYALAVVIESATSSSSSSFSSSSSNSTSSSFSLFDEAWKRDGFCVTNGDVPYQTSHDLCLYVDSILVSLFGLLYYANLLPTLPKEGSMTKDVKQLFQLNLVATAAHGLAHGGIAAAIRDGTVAAHDQSSIGMEWLNGSSNSFATLSIQELFIKLLPNLIFWLAFLKVILPNVNHVYIFLGIWPIQLIQVFVPTQLSFVFVQTVILLLFSVNQLLRPKHEKEGNSSGSGGSGFAYASMPIITSIPTTLIGWMESTMCSTLVRDTFYGHLLYDVYTMVGVVLWYCACAHHAAAKEQGTTTATLEKKLY